MTGKPILTITAAGISGNADVNVDWSTGHPESASVDNTLSCMLLEKTAANTTLNLTV